MNKFVTDILKNTELLLPWEKCSEGFETQLKKGDFEFSRFT